MTSPSICRLMLCFALDCFATAAAAEAPSPPAPVAEAPAEHFSLFATTGYLASSAGAGAAVSSGVRLSLGSHLAGSFDLGYGLLGPSTDAQDRWWVVPALALVLPAGRVRFDLGAGVGVGTSSGYASWSAYAAKPFGPTWHDTVPAARLHAVAVSELSRSFDLVARIEAGTLLGVRGAPPADTTWVLVGFGVQSRWF